jgi:hypothetical protein
MKRLQEGPRSRKAGVPQCCIGFETLEPRYLLANVCDVPLWDGERVDGPDQNRMLNYFGGGLGASRGATISYETDVVHSGNGAYGIHISPTLAQNNFAYVQTTLGATGFPAPYMDTRDLTPYQYVSFWINNQTGAPLEIQLEIQDYRTISSYHALWSQSVSSKSQWVQIQAPLDLSNKGWTVTTAPDLTQARLFSFVIVANQGSSVGGTVYLDDLDLIEPGGPVDPLQTSPSVLAQRLAKREFDALWGSRDHNTGLLPDMSSWEDVMALNVTAGLVKAVPNAVAQGWISSSSADAYVAQVVQTLGTILNQSSYLPARYVDRVSLQPDSTIEESSVDAAYMYLALYQYQSLPGTSAALRSNIGQVLARFNFKPFETPQGWLMSYRPATSTFTGVYDEYSGEIGVISLAADLAGQVDISALYNSGVNRVSVSTLDSSSSYIVPSLSDYRSPFVEWIFPLFVNVSGPLVDDYPVAALASNPLANATAYQRDVDARLAAEGRATMLQPDAGDDYTGTHYEDYSIWDDFGQPTLFMPWSVSSALLGDPSAGGTALQQLLASSVKGSFGYLQGPFGLVDSAFWATGDSGPTNVAARNDLWNTSVSLMSLDQDLYQDNQYLTSAPAVQSAIAEIFHTVNLSGTSFSFTGGPTPANWTIVVDGQKVTNIPATTTVVNFTGIGTGATATITGASATGEYAAISPGQATYGWTSVGSNVSNTVTATNVFSASVTSGSGAGTLSVTDATGGNILAELPTSTTLASASNSANQVVAKGFNNVVATATGAGSGTVAELFGSSAADTFTANPQSAVMQDTSQTAYRLEADGFTTVHGIGGTGGDTALLTDAAGGVFNATSTLATLSGTGYSIIANNFASVQATAVGPSDVAYLQAGPGTNLFTGSKGKSKFKGVNFDNVALDFFTVDAWGAATGYNTAMLTDSSGIATATLNPHTAALTDASTQAPASYQINLPSGFQMVQTIEASLLGSSKAILKGSSTAANSFISTSTTATLAPSTGNAYREYEQGFATVQAISTYATDTASLYDSPGSDTFTATPASATMSLATQKTVVASGFKTVNAYSIYGGTDTASLTGTAGADAAWLYSTNALMRMSTGNTVRAWYFAKYNLDGDGGGDTVTTMDASVLPTKQTTVAGARIIAWLADFAEMNQDYGPGSPNQNKSYPIAVDQVLTAYWS